MGQSTSSIFEDDDDEEDDSTTSNNTNTDIGDEIEFCKKPNINHTNNSNSISFEKKH